MYKLSIVSKNTLIPIKSVGVKVNTCIYWGGVFYSVILPDLAHKEKF